MMFSYIGRERNLLFDANNISGRSHEIDLALSSGNGAGKWRSELANRWS